MEDRDLMEKELLIIKGVCDLYLHGAIESTTSEVHSAFKEALNESLNVQNKLYNNKKLMQLNKSILETKKEDSFYRIPLFSLKFKFYIVSIIFLVFSIKSSLSFNSSLILDNASISFRS